MNININPEDIDVYVKEAILKSTFGGCLKEEIEKAVKNLGNSWDSPFRKMVNEVVKEKAKEYLDLPQNKIAIQEAVANIITPKSIETLLQYGLQRLQKDLEDEYS